MELPDSINLYFREGTSDKVYHAEIVARGDGFVVNFAYGRRGAKMQTGSKTPKPVSRAKAEEIYSKLITEKTDKGYATDEPDAAPIPPPRGEIKAKAKGESAAAADAAEPVSLDAGTMKWDGSAWKQTVDAPAFKAFKYGGSKGKTDVVFYADDEDDKPSPAAIAVAAKVLANQKELATKVIEALWEDFNGEGPDSGMYWHGDLDQVAEGLEMADDEVAPPKKTRDLFKLMSCPTIAVHKEVDGYDKPIVELSFGAAFEEEHGVGVLTDGAKIIGIGYSYDVTPFESDGDEDGDGEDNE